MAVIPTQLPVYRLDAVQYARIVGSGALEDLRVELIDGLIVDRSPHSPQHAAVITRLTRRFAGAASRLLVQLPIQVAADSVPEPDLAIVDEPESAEHHPTSALLVVEVRAAPGPARYRTLRTLEPGEVLPSPCQGIAELAVDEFLEGV